MARLSDISIPVTATVQNLDELKQKLNRIQELAVELQNELDSIPEISVKVKFAPGVQVQEQSVIIVNHSRIEIGLEPIPNGDTGFISKRLMETSKEATHGEEIKENVDLERLTLDNLDENLGEKFELPYWVRAVENDIRAFKGRVAALEARVQAQQK